MANGTRLTARCHFTGPKKVLISRAQLPPTCPRNEKEEEEEEEEDVVEVRRRGRYGGREKEKEVESRRRC